MFGISCWHQNEHESEAMWKLYSASGQGIAIESTDVKLKKAITDTKGLIIDKVRYMDFDNDPIEKGHRHYRLFLKRKSFDHERELRATVLLPEVGKGVYVPCDLDILISSIHLSPFVPEYFKIVVQALCIGKTRILRKDIHQSKLFDEPNYGIEINVNI